MGSFLIALWTHTAHAVSLLPYLVILACPLMHLFMHRKGHGGAHDHERHP